MAFFLMTARAFSSKGGKWKGTVIDFLPKTNILGKIESRDMLGPWVMALKVTSQPISESSSTSGRKDRR